MIFELRRNIVKALVNRNLINKRCELRVKIKLNILVLREQTSSLDFNSFL